MKDQINEGVDKIKKAKAALWLGPNIFLGVRDPNTEIMLYIIVGNEYK